MRIIGGIVAVSLAFAGPVLAQNSSGFEPAFSAEDDLDCAIFVGALLAQDEEVLTTENRVGLTSAFTYFTGRYEAQRGIELTEAFTSRYPIYLQRNPAEIQQTCSVRMRAFGARLHEAGSALTRLAPVPPLPQVEETQPSE